MRACRRLPRTSPEAHPALAHKGRQRPPHRCGSCQRRAGATSCLTGRDARDRLRLLASSWRANASMPSAVKHVASLPGDSRLRRCRRFLPPVTGDPQQHHPVNRIVGAFSSIGALPRILRIQLGQRHRRYSLSRAQTHACSDVPSLLGADVRYATQCRDYCTVSPQGRPRQVGRYPSGWQARTGPASFSFLPSRLER
jgi:hypothetical protein